MSRSTEATKITCEVYKTIAAEARAALGALGIGHAHVHSRRAVVLRERTPIPFLPPVTGLDEDPAEVFETYVPRRQARDVLLALARALRLFVPGRGSLFAEEVEVRSPAGLDICNLDARAPEAGEMPGERLAPLVLLNCVVQRGYGNEIARSALEMGNSVPSVNFGIGTGVRDRLGLLRIAIPAEKEIVSLLVEPQDQEETLEALIDAGRLDQPGKGFIGAYPVASGVGNPRFFRGKQRHRATMEQMISAIDDLQAGTAWRLRTGAGERAPRAERQWLTDLINVVLICNEGSSSRLVAAAMGAGAGGATISKAKHFSTSGGKIAGVSPAREVIDLGITAANAARLVDALQASGAADADAACVIETKPLPMAFTYVPK